MKPTDPGTLILAAIAAIGLIGAVIAWFFKRGGDERAFSVALNDNTDALRELAGEFRKFRDEVIDKLHGLDIRVTRLEVAPPPIHVTTKVEAPSDGSSPTDRNAGTPS